MPRENDAHTVDRRSFVAAGASAVAGLLGLPEVMAQERSAADGTPGATAHPPAEAYVFEFGPDGEVSFPQLPHRDGNGAAFRNKAGEIIAILEVARLLHVDKLEAPDMTMQEVARLDIEVDVVFCWDPSNGRGLDQRAGHARYEVGLLDADGLVSHRLESRTVSWPVSVKSGYVLCPYENASPRFGKLRLPLPAKGYLAVSIVEDAEPDSFRRPAK